MNNAQDFRQAAENAGAEEIYEDGSQEFNVFEDDGNYFIEQFGLRAAFDSSKGQDSSRGEFNREVNESLKQMGYKVRYNGKGVV